MTDRQSLNAARDRLFDMACRLWREDGWVIQHETTCTIKRHTGEAVLAWLDEDEHIVHFLPHPTEKGQPAERTLLHEWMHILFGKTVHRARDERDIEWWEATLWPMLTRRQRQTLRNVLGPTV